MNVLGRLIEKPRFWFAIILGLMGITFFIASYTPYCSWRPLRDFGSALTIAMLVAITVDVLVHESLLDKVTNAAHTLTESMSHGSDVLNGAIELKVLDIFARRKGKGMDRCWSKIQNAIEIQLEKGTGEILIMGVAAPDIFRFDRAIGHRLKEQIVLPECDCKLRALLLCPDSEWAKVRQNLEQFHTTIDDIHAASRFLAQLDYEINKPNKILFHCYDLPPTAYLIITDEFIFIEPYPLAKVTGAIGGITPMLMFDKQSEPYWLWRANFKHFWRDYSRNYMEHHRKDLS